MKKMIVFVLVGLLSFSYMLAEKQANSSRLTSNKVQVMMAGTNKVVPQNSLGEFNIPTNTRNWEQENGLVRIKNNQNGNNDEGGTRSCPDGTDACWDLSYMPEADSYYYLSSGGAGDTFAVVFTPAAPCIVQEVYQQWFSAGNCVAFGADYGDASQISPDGNCWDIDEQDLSPVGTLRTNPTPNTIEAYNADWSSVALLDIGGTFQVGDSGDLSNPPPFVIGFVKGGDTPQPLSNNNDITGRTETYTWMGGPWNAEDDGLWANYNNVVDLMMLVKVTYPWGAPIAANPGILSNTYATTDTRTVEIDLFDDVDTDGSGMAINGDDDVHLHVEINGVEVSDLDLNSAYAIDTGADGNGLWGWDVTYTAAAGDVISYWVSSEDNDGLLAESTSNAFSIIAPTYPDADLLIIDDGGNDYQTGYEEAAALYGLSFETWVANDNAGIDWSVINHGWSNIIVYGWGISTLPAIASATDPGYGDFLDGGGNLVVVDHDWFFGQNLDSYPNVLTFGPGDPAYDWFGISGGVNDPDDDGDSSNGGSGDTSLVSLVEGLPDLFLNHAKYTSLNWTDFMTPGLADPIYEGLNTEEVVGVQYDNGTSKTALISFMADAAVDSTEGVPGSLEYVPEFWEFVNYFLDWFAIDGPPMVSDIMGSTGTVYGDAAQEVTAEVSETNGDAFTVAVEWSTDGGATWDSAAMSENARTFVGSIPGQAGGTTVDYRVSATDEEGTTTSMGGSYFVYAPSSDILWVFNNEMAGGQYPDDYYFYEGNYTGNFLYSPDIWFGGVNAELLEFYDIVMEIGTTLTWADQTDHYDIIHDWLNTGGKSYFLAGDEVLGMLTGWANGPTADGSLFNDMGIGEIFHDIGSPGVPNALDAVMGDMLSGDMYDAVPAGSAIMYDPEYETGFDNWLDGMAPTASATGFLTDTASGYDVGVYNEWDNGSRTVFCGFDPLSLNSAPDYYWFGASYEGPTVMSADWFTCAWTTLGDPSEDGNVDVLDVVGIVGDILGTNDYYACRAEAADANADGGVDVLDVVLVVSWILNPGRTGEYATTALINVDDNQVSYIANGIVDAFQITLSHEAGVTVELTNDAMVAQSVSDGITTTMIIVAPESSELFTASGDFEIVEFLAASGEDYVDVSLGIPTSFALNAAYPNPFNPTTTIGYAVPIASDVRVVVYDMLGRQAAILVNSNIEAGNYSVNWNASDLSSGMYLVRMTAGDFTRTQKIMLIK
ncbi:MAG: T9SS type A sorting domain-containing protein [Candidatus Marinimicrobia bacterium]|nr:T9SS type A sorting domain-containing protein [Candidatus Neomarinimicrobiota bacterium]MBT3633949.1 T9SS type A sorting domain-containing protein [Candidatus Neomarinimicrobiota bacterium]MBT3682802.1 T9SS type A sorting domain-containing protein [Candidatus Neomarinimicrobiota bacterium]MBT3760011.1 T9SS type A sorting domain-containing protein [Candidatus Neomarinimicrobiota bacterium]MBT3896105.1 T9SS type A sorting domain-containing protein [Candidatus Neomarinimicrobiota bacterium]